MIKKGLNVRLAEIGKIKIGGKGKEIESKQNKKKFRQPVKFDYFLVATTERGADGNFIPDPDVAEALKGQGIDKPKELSIRLPFDDIDLNFFTSFQFYEGRKLKCKGDGESATRNMKDGTVKTVTCDPDKCEYMESGKCKVSGILSCYVSASPSYGGVYRFRTHSWNSVSNILAALNEFQRNTGGILQGLPLKLKMLKKSTEEHGNVNTVTIVLDGIAIKEMRELAAAESANRIALNVDIKKIEHKAIEDGFIEDTDEPEDVADEFYADEPEDDSPGTSADQAQEKIDPKPEQAEADAQEQAEAPETEVPDGDPKAGNPMF